jgi:hypothetical protein
MAKGGLQTQRLKVFNESIGPIDCIGLWVLLASNEPIILPDSLAQIAERTRKFYELAQSLLKRLRTSSTSQISKRIR